MGSLDVPPHLTGGCFSCSTVGYHVSHRRSIYQEGFTTTNHVSTFLQKLRFAEEEQIGWRRDHKTSATGTLTHSIGNVWLKVFRVRSFFLGIGFDGIPDIIVGRTAVFGQTMTINAFSAHDVEPPPHGGPTCPGVDLRSGVLDLFGPIDGHCKTRLRAHDDILTGDSKLRAADLWCKNNFVQVISHTFCRAPCAVPLIPADTLILSFFHSIAGDSQARKQLTSEK